MRSSRCSVDRCGLWAANEAARQWTPRFAVLVSDLAGHNCGDVAVGTPHETLAARGQVVDHLRSPRGETFEVDHVDIRAIAGREHAPVEQTDGAGGGTRVTLHRERKIEPTSLAVARPEGQ